MLVALVVACEAAFWVVLGSGLVARYVLRRRRLGAVLLVAAPCVDLVLLTASALDLRAGGVATPAHALAAIYLGVSVGFGRRMVAWADARFAHRFAGGRPAPRKPRQGAAHAAYQRTTWLRHALAWAVGTGLMGLAVLVVGDQARTGSLRATGVLWTLVLVVDGVVSLSYTLRPRPEPTSVK